MLDYAHAIGSDFTNGHMSIRDTREQIQILKQTRCAVDTSLRERICARNENAVAHDRERERQRRLREIAAEQARLMEEAERLRKG